MTASTATNTISFANLPKVEGLLGPFNVSSERWREYVQEDGTTYRIDNPVALYRRDDGTTHRVVDIEGVVHCVPCGKLHPNTVIRWQNRDITNPVNW